MRDMVAIIGSGMMGSGIGAMAALAGNKTVLMDVDQKRAENGLARAIECIALRTENGLNTAEEAERARALLSISTNMEAAGADARLVIDAIVEDLAVKQELFARLDTLLPPEVPICSNTSGLRITEISAKCCHAERTVTTHFWLPAHLVPLVEVVMGDRTSIELAQQIVCELKRWQKSPVLVKRDLPGQLANRIFQAIIREAVDIVSSGLASAEDVDTAISCGMAMRFPEWGPLKHLDAIGLELGLKVQDSVLPDICNEKKAGDYLRQLVEKGDTGVKAGKGFYDWSQRDIQEDMSKRDLFIMEAVKVTKRLENH